MSREIEFRVFYKPKGYYLFDGKGLTLEELAKELHGGHVEALGGSVTHAFEQYTGAKDKNGKEIYEGDIVKVYSRKKLLDGLYKVVWNEEACGFECESLKPMIDGGDSILKDVRVFNEYYAKFCVVGNIHKNPKLRKEKK